MLSLGIVFILLWATLAIAWLIAAAKGTIPGIFGALLATLGLWTR